MTTNGPLTAEVQVLTAEVRVLQVGSRQITLSVYRQLDVVSPEDIEPWGRVEDRTLERQRQRDWSRFMDGEATHVVGRHRKTGALVRSWAVLSTLHQRYWEAWQPLPLIVLAGLR